MVETAHELFLHGLSDVLDAERQLVEALSQQAESAGNEQLKKAFENHLKQTQGQVERLEQVFEQLEEEAQDTDCRGMQGLIEEVDNFKQEQPSPDILDVFLVGAAAKVESYEIRAYEELIQLATDMDHKKAVRLLQQNLREEQQTLKKMEGFAKKIKPERSGMEEEEIEEKGQEDRQNSRNRKGSSSSRGKSRKAA
ncbi:MAG TPA: DUF892 family protein [Candidatus Limnocylindrales bacterium]|jgi:ferritin-like metal-binding protein YciE|nr:DUF892 family protein [Candidatus Limnocylindrales bacterium]